MIKAHVIKLYPNKEQEIFFKKSSGTARFAYNWALNRWSEYYNLGINTTGYNLRKEFNSIKKDQYPWTSEVGKCATDYPILNVEKAFKKFFKEKIGRPKFKKKGQKDSFVAVENYQAFKQENKKIRIPRLGWVKCAEDLRFGGKVNSVVIKRIATNWFAVVNVDVNEQVIADREDKRVIGIDFGIKELAVCSDGRVFVNPKALKKRLRSLKRQQRSLSRKVKGSENRKKQMKKLATLHYKVSCVRKNAIHQTTRKIIDSADIIVIEDLNVSGMVKNHNLAQAIHDVSFYEFRRQLEYKAKWEGKKVIVADRFYPSSKTCSCCGHRKETLNISERTYKCEECGFVMDRDLNAAKNLANLALPGKPRDVKAFGEDRAALNSGGLLRIRN